MPLGNWEGAETYAGSQETCLSGYMPDPSRKGGLALWRD